MKRVNGEGEGGVDMLFSHHLVASPHRDGDCLEVRVALNDKHLDFGGAKGEGMCRILPVGRACVEF